MRTADTVLWLVYINGNPMVVVPGSSTSTEEEMLAEPTIMQMRMAYLEKGFTFTAKKAADAPDRDLIVANMSLTMSVLMMLQALSGGGH